MHYIYLTTFGEPIFLFALDLGNMSKKEMDDVMDAIDCELCYN